MLVVHSTQDVETISLCLTSSLIREHIGLVETQLQGLLERIVMEQKEVRHDKMERLFNRNIAV